MALAISRSAPFRHLQKQIGSATYRLNTILVGLEAIADGASKPPRLPVTWTKPSGVDQAQNAAKQASTFACTSSLVLAFDIYDQFLSNLAAESWLGFSVETQGIATKSKTRPASEGGAYSIAERTTALLTELKVAVGPSVSALELMSKWRNVVVHTKERNNALSSDAEKILISESEYFHGNYSHFDINLALNNYRTRKSPVPKEATSLIAIVQNVSRSLDEAAIIRVSGTTDLMTAATENLLVEYFSHEGRRIASNAEIAEAWQGPRERRAANLTKIMQKIGVTDNKNKISAVLPDSYLDEIIDSTSDKIISRFIKS